MIYDDDYDTSWWPESGALTATAEQQLFRVCRALAASQEALAFCSQNMADPFTDHPLSDDALLAIVEATSSPSPSEMCGHCGDLRVNCADSEQRP